MAEGKSYKLKICLVGESGVGKTSLINKYVYNEFDDKYITTLGTKPSKKEIKLKHPKDDGFAVVSLVIWDIMGQRGFRQLLQEAYFSGAQGIIAVCDNTRKNTLSDLSNWINAVYNITEEIPMVILGNKCDLENDLEVGLDDLQDFASGYESSEVYLSSAKTGLNVELTFKTLSEKILEEKRSKVVFKG